MIMADLIIKGLDLNKLLTILFLVFLFSCTKEYVHYNPDHPQEYLGSWACDSTYLNGVKNNNSIKENFLIMQTGVDVWSSQGYPIISSDNWRLDKTKTPPAFILLNAVNDIMKVYDVVKEPLRGNMALRTDTLTFYLTQGIH
jgi:hypothetical protein